MAGAKLGGDGDEFPLQPLDGHVLQMVLETAAQALAGDQARASEVDVEKAEDPAGGQRRGEILERLKAAGHVAGAGDGTDGRSSDDVRLKSGVDQGLEHPDMSPSAGRAAAKGDANNRSRHLTQPTLCLAFDLAISRSKDRQERLQPRVLEAHRRK